MKPSDRQAPRPKGDAEIRITDMGRIIGTCLYCSYVYGCYYAKEYASEKTAVRGLTKHINNQHTAGVVEIRVERTTNP